MPSWLKQKLEAGGGSGGGSGPARQGDIARPAKAAHPRSQATRRPKQQRERRRYERDDDDGGADGAAGVDQEEEPDFPAAAAAAPSRKRPRAAAFARPGSPPRAAAAAPSRPQKAAAVDGFWSDEEDEIEEPKPKPKRRARPKAAAAPRRAPVTEAEAEEYYSPEALDKTKPEFPKLVDPPFRSANVPLVLSPLAGDALPVNQRSLEDPPDDAATLTVPASAAQYLREYQKEGIQFLYQQYIRNLGGVLGDDMGLGKTCMCVNFLAAVLHKTCLPGDRIKCGADDGRCCLIVVPASVIHQWQAEFARWVYTSVLTMAKGSDIEPVMRKVRAGGVVEVVIVGHDRFRMSADEICSYEWHLAIFDEAHKMKNAAAKLVEATNKLQTNRRYVSKNDEFCIKNEKSCTKNEKVCIKNKGFCVKTDEFCRV